MKRLDSFEITIDGKSVCGTITCLSPKGMTITIDDPIECHAYRCSKDKKYASRIDGIITANAEGVSAARELLVKLHEQATYLVSHMIDMGLFINEYIARRDYKTDCLRVLTMKETDKYRELKEELENLLPDMRKHYFPLLADLEMDEPFLKRYSEQFLGLSFDSERNPI